MKLSLAYSPRVHRAHAVKLAHQDRGQQVVYRRGIVRMPIQQLLELLDRPVVIHVVEVLEGSVDQRIVPGESVAADVEDASRWRRVCAMA